MLADERVMEFSVNGPMSKPQEYIKEYIKDTHK